MSEDGPAAVNGRLKDMIIAGGFNIYPADVERAMLGHPAVREAAVIGVPEDYRDETARMIVSLRRGEQLDLKHLKEFLSGRLSPMERGEVTGRRNCAATRPLSSPNQG